MKTQNPQSTIVYTLGRSPFLREAVESVKPSLESKYGGKYQVKLKVKSCLTSGADSHGDYLVKTTAVVSKANKSRFEKVLHFFGLLPSAKVKTKDTHMMLLDQKAISDRVLENTAKSVEGFEQKLKNRSKK